MVSVNGRIVLLRMHCIVQSIRPLVTVFDESGKSVHQTTMPGRFQGAYQVGRSAVGAYQHEEEQEAAVRRVHQGWPSDQRRVLGHGARRGEDSAREGRRHTQIWPGSLWKRILHSSV